MSPSSSILTGIETRAVSTGESRLARGCRRSRSDWRQNDGLRTGLHIFSSTARPHKLADDAIGNAYGTLVREVAPLRRTGKAVCL